MNRTWEAPNPKKAPITKFEMASSPQPSPPTKLVLPKEEREKKDAV
jgi:hypothetical protein